MEVPWTSGQRGRKPICLVDVRPQSIHRGGGARAIGRPGRPIGSAIPLFTPRFRNEIIGFAG